MSTASGIPDFRSASGIYSDARNVNVFDLDEFIRNPEPFYCFAREFYPKVLAAKPNKAHLALAGWEAAGKRIEIATQNVDDFHQRAGSKAVYPVHGTFLRSTCVQCHSSCRTADFTEAILGGVIPRCSCGGVIKPDITFFGEMLPVDAWEKSACAMATADLVLVLGTSLQVYPAAALPGYRRSDAILIVVNREPTPLDERAYAAIQGDLSDVMHAVSTENGFS